jgi:uncharacterized membrane protein YfcA
METAATFVHLDLIQVAYLLAVGFVGGLVSGFIGSGGAFVLTPAMMSLGVPAIVAVASNMCHKFPKALVGAIKRARYGHVDVKLGVVLGLSAEAGVLTGRTFRRASGGLRRRGLEPVRARRVVVAMVVGDKALWDAVQAHRSGRIPRRGESEPPGAAPPGDPHPVHDDVLPQP